jgi:hypothetical protein
MIIRTPISWVVGALLNTVVLYFAYKDLNERMQIKGLIAGKFLNKK